MHLPSSTTVSHFEPCKLHGDQRRIFAYQECRPGFFSQTYARGGSLGPLRMPHPTILLYASGIARSQSPASSWWQNAL